MKKKSFVIVCTLGLLVFLLCGILFYALHAFQNKGLVLIKSWEEAYDYNGKLLLSKDDRGALLVKTLGKTEFEPIEKKEIDLTPFGFEGEVFSCYPVTVDQGYGVFKTYLYTSDPSYEGFWPVLSPDRFVYTASDGKRYCIHPKEGLCYPMFSDSIEGVDVYGEDVLAFSANASYAIALSGDTVKIYHTDPMDDSLRIVDVKKVSLKDYGKSFTFGAFVGNTQAYLYTEKEDLLLAIDCETGEVANSLLPEGEYGAPISRLYAQNMKEEKGDLRARWNHLLLGTSFSSPKLKGFDRIELVSVSQGGKYAVGRAEGETNEVLVLGEKRSVSLSSYLAKGEEVEKVDFVYENLIYVTLKTDKGESISRCFRICF